jgi:peptide-methionine (S)-S-oxide reductase
MKFCADGQSSTNMKQLFWTLLAAGIFPFAAAAQTNSNSMSTNKTELATFGGGCFWCMEAVYERLPGVLAVTSGFAGGQTENPTYHQVCGGDTGHAEVTQIEFDPAKISFAQLLDVFWQAHDPTTLNRQGADTGTQYRSIILYHDAKQKLVAEQSRDAVQKNFAGLIVTEIVPFKRAISMRTDMNLIASTSSRPSWKNWSTNKSSSRPCRRPNKKRGKDSRRGRRIHFGFASSQSRMSAARGFFGSRSSTFK